MTDASESVDAASRVVRVTLYEDRAEVIRGAIVRVEPGARLVRIGGPLSPALDDRSVRVRVTRGDATVLGARVLRVGRVPEGASSEELDAIEREYRAAAAAARTEAAAVERSERDLAVLATLVGRWGEALGHVPRAIAAEASRGNWRTAYDELSNGAAQSVDTWTHATARRLAAVDQAERAARRLESAESRRPRWEAFVEVQLHVQSEPANAAPDASPGNAGEDQREIEIEVTYRTPCAVWRPEHAATLETTEGTRRGTVEIVTFATAWNATGEDWVEVPMRFSTARPARAATPPPLVADVIASRRKTEVERSRVVVSAREQMIVAAGLDRGARLVDEMPGVDDGGEPLTFEASGTVSVPSNRRAVRVEIARVKLAATVERVAMAERSQVAHVRATATLSAKTPMLAGPLRLASGGTIVGRATQKFVAAGEPFEMGFGPDDAVRVRRKVSEERESTTLSGTQIVRRSVAVYLSNLSDLERVVQLIERVPVSEIEEVTSRLREHDGWEFDEADGFLRRAVTLAPNATERVAYDYEIRAASKVVLPF